MIRQIIILKELPFGIGKIGDKFDIDDAVLNDNDTDIGYFIKGMLEDDFIELVEKGKE